MSLKPKISAKKLARGDLVFRRHDGVIRTIAINYLLRVAIAVAAFGQRLRAESALDGYAYATIAALSDAARGSDPEGYRAELVRLIRMADTLRAVSQR